MSVTMCSGWAGGLHLPGVGVRVDMEPGARDVLLVDGVLLDLLGRVRLRRAGLAEVTTMHGRGEVLRVLEDAVVVHACTRSGETLVVEEKVLERGHDERVLERERLRCVLQVVGEGLRDEGETDEVLAASGLARRSFLLGVRVSGARGTFVCSL